MMTVPLDETVSDDLDRRYRRAKNGLADPMRPLLDALIEGEEFCLNAEQLAGLVHDHGTDGPCLLLAGAGSGKTAVMTRRIVYLYLQGYSLDDVWAVTFTNKAAREMRDRVEGILQYLWTETEHDELKEQLETVMDRLEEAWIGTFHSLGRRLLEMEHPNREKPLVKLVRHAYSAPIRLLDPDEQWELLETIYQTSIDGADDYSLSAVFNRVEEWRRNMIDPRRANRDADNPFKETAADLYEDYQRRKRHRRPGVLDFQDLLVFPTRLLRKHRTAGRFLKDQFAHVLIDEFQDTNPVQFTLSKQLAEPDNRLFAVGDDAQSIYGWRGAEIRHIQKFEATFPEATVRRLETNYRSNATIVMGANDVFADDPTIYDKELSPGKGDDSGLDYGKDIALLRCHSGREERGWLGYEIERLVQHRGYKYGDIAVFYRINQQQDPIKRYFEDQDIPHVVLGDTAFFEWPVVHDIRCFYRVLEGMYHARTGDELEDIDAYGEALTGWFSREESEYEVSIHETAGMRGRVFDVMIDDNEQNEFTEALSPHNRSIFKEDREQFEQAYVALEDGASMVEIYDQIVGELSFEATNQQTSLTDDAASLCRDWIERTQENPGLRGLETFLESVKQQTRDPQFVPGDPDQFVKMTTLHGAKGLEFPVVLFTGLDEGVCPYTHPGQDDWDKDRLREEKRLFYVGITRAEERLVLIHARQRDWFGSVRTFKPSRFLELLPEDLTVEIEPPRSFAQRMNAVFVR